METYVLDNYVDSLYVEGYEVASTDLLVLDALNGFYQLLQKFDTDLANLKNSLNFELLSLKNIVNSVYLSQTDLFNSFDEINQSKLNGYITTAFSNLDLSAFDISAIESAVINVITQNVTGIISEASLNGYGSEFKDGDLVTVTGRDVVYSVSRSFFSIYSENAYTIHYAVASQDGQRLIVPEALLERYVAPAVTTP